MLINRIMVFVIFSDVLQCCCGGKYVQIFAAINVNAQQTKKKATYFSEPEKPKIDITTLHLYRILESLFNNIEQKNKALLVDQSFEKDESDVFFAAHTLVQKALKYMELVVDGFNSDRFAHTPELAQRFVHMCNAQTKTEYMSLNHLDLYTMCDRIKIFNNRIMQYGATYTTFLEPEDVEFFKNIGYFNYAVMFCLRQEQLFDFGIIDMLLAWLFYKPYNLVCIHPWLSMVIVICVLIVLGCGGVILYHKVIRPIIEKMHALKEKGLDEA